MESARCLVDDFLVNETWTLLWFQAVEKRNKSVASLISVFYREGPSAISGSYSNRCYAVSN